MKRISALSLLLLLLGLASACHSLKATDRPGQAELKVQFFNYQTSVTHYEIVDTNRQVFNEWYDEVYMRVLSDGPWKNRVYAITLGEYPIREAFKNRETESLILIPPDKLKGDGTGGQLSPIFSGDITFK